MYRLPVECTKHHRLFDSWILFLLSSHLSPPILCLTWLLEWVGRRPMQVVVLIGPLSMGKILLASCVDSVCEGKKLFTMKTLLCYNVTNRFVFVELYFRRTFVISSISKEKKNSKNEKSLRNKIFY
jgi:hypothetical protein